MNNVSALNLLADHKIDINYLSHSVYRRKREVLPLLVITKEYTWQMESSCIEFFKVVTLLIESWAQEVDL